MPSGSLSHIEYVVWIGVMVLELYYFVLFRNIRRFGKSLGQKKKQKIIFWAFGSWNNNKNWNFGQGYTVVEWKWKLGIFGLGPLEPLVGSA